jgi:hypothetical protein
VPDRRSRIRGFVEAYGDLPDFDAPDLIASQIEATVRVMTSLAAQGVEPQRTWVANGDLAIETDDLRWIRDHRHLLE